MHPRRRSAFRGPSALAERVGELVPSDTRGEVLFECDECEAAIILLTDGAEDLEEQIECPVCSSFMDIAADGREPREEEE